MPPYPARSETPPPPPAILAPFLDTGEDSRPAAGPAPRIHIIPITVEPRTPTMLYSVWYLVSVQLTQSRKLSLTSPLPFVSSKSGIYFQDRSSHMPSDARGQMSKESGTTSSQASGKASGMPSSTMSDPTAMSSTSQSTKLSGTRQKSHSLPLTDKSKAADLRQRSLMRGGANSLVPFCGCIVVLLVFLILLCFMLWADSDSHHEAGVPKHLREYAGTT
ncbi:uncharacterized protein [Dermacentor andersoni]|uniref:uncharacterized protein n=1 Tax=Dermacentor andersoni TaxID=34620 RepID=UPI0024169311|nr:uncharacterized protein LOC129383880 [Dermacentor andersoni]